MRIGDNNFPHALNIWPLLVCQARPIHVYALRSNINGVPSSCTARLYTCWEAVCAQKVPSQDRHLSLDGVILPLHPIRLGAACRVTCSSTGYPFYQRLSYCSGEVTPATRSLSQSSERGCLTCSSNSTKSKLWR